MIQLYQTVEDRDNPDYIEANGPILCRSNAWLGPGYYFWDTFYENAEWWGQSHYNGKYMICATESCHEADMFDLVGNTQHLMELGKAAKLLRDKGSRKDVYVAHVLAFLKGEIKSFCYKAVRANGIFSKSYTGLEEQLLYFPKNYSYLELVPPLQICVYDKSFLTGTYRVIYPPQYCNDYTI